MLQLSVGGATPDEEVTEDSHLWALPPPLPAPLALLRCPFSLTLARQLSLETAACAPPQTTQAWRNPRGQGVSAEPHVPALNAWHTHFLPTPGAN